MSSPIKITLLVISMVALFVLQAWVYRNVTYEPFGWYPLKNALVFFIPFYFGQLYSATMRSGK